MEKKLSAWVTSLWDLGLDIGHSVRTVSDCEREAAADITIITNLMEARLLCGSTTLFDLMQRIISTEHMWDSASYFNAKMAEQNKRRRKFQTNAYRLEPNVKESQGGLRDIQMISWVCQRQFGTRDLADLVSNELLTVEEFETLQEALQLIWRIRYLLHCLAGRREDRLLFDYQRDIAHAFGYTNDTDNNSIEQLMQRFYRSVMALQRLNEIMLQGIGGVIAGVTAATQPVAVNKRFQVRNGFLEVTHNDVFVHYPPALLEVFIVFGNTLAAKNVRTNTVRLIRSHLPLINNRFRSDPVVRSLFMEVFRNPKKLTRKIRMMNRYGVLAAYLPAFDAIVGRMQYDLFHIYTVDEHTSFVIRNLRRFDLPKFDDQLPHASYVMKQVDRPDLLYLTGLFHDIAKGRGGDHSVLGAEDAAVFCKEHGLAKRDVDLIVWVVRHHLLMSITAQRKDISDPDVQLEFAKIVGTMRNLNNLYLLTIADIRATNPELWNSFKESLLRSLYQSTTTLLTKGLDQPVDSANTIARRRVRTHKLLTDSELESPRITQFLDNLDDDYIRQYHADEIARHAEFILANQDTSGPLIALRQSVSRGSTEILIYVLNDNSLFALITTVLDQLQLDVQSATINTTNDGHALDTFYILESDGSLIEDPDRIEQIKSSLQRELNAPQNIPALGVIRPSRQLKHFSIPTLVEFDSDDSKDFTEVRITAADRPGILSSISRAMLRANVSVLAARIATLGEKIDDVFFVRHADGSALANDADRKRLATMLIERI